MKMLFFIVSERKREKKKVIQGWKLIKKTNFPNFQGDASHHHFSSLKTGKITFHDQFSSLNYFFFSGLRLLLVKKT